MGLGVRGITGLALPGLLLKAILLGLTLNFIAFSGSCDSMDAIGFVVRVVDGDTFIVRVTYVSARFSESIRVDLEYRVRLADINAPELSTKEGLAAKEALAKLISGRTVILDVDDVNLYDRYGRLVAVAYIEFNETHLLNINKWVLDNGYAVVWDHDNEFDPSQWALYVRAESPPQTVTPRASPEEHTPSQYDMTRSLLRALLPLLVIAIAVVLLVMRRRLR